MKIVHVASELFPYVKTGGLADVVSALAAALADMGHETAVFLPGYREVLEHPDMADAQRIHSLGIEMGDRFLHGEVLLKKLGENRSLYLICRDEFYDRRHPYGIAARDYQDNAERFIFFSKAVVEVLSHIRFKADIVHCHDWQAGLIPLLLRFAEQRQGTLLAGRTVLTIHNLAYQGIFPMAMFPLTGLPDELRKVDGLEYYGQVNFLKGGILFADWISTVSPTYSREILTSEYGCGLEGVLAERKNDLFCQINGIDTGLWDPETDEHLPARYSATDLSGKKTCQNRLLKQLGLKQKGSGAVFGMICRLAEQKGLELLRECIGYFLSMDRRLIVLGSGNPIYESWLCELAAAHPEIISVQTGMDEKLSHLIEAGSDFFLMPSVFEPCGLNQMYSMRYGTLPIASHVGGLADTVIDVDKNPEDGTGISFVPTPAGFKDGLERAHSLHADPKRMRAAVIRAMTKDFSWKRAAAGYVRLYESSL